MLEDRFPDLMHSIYNMKILVNASYKVKQSLIGKRLTPAIFLSEFYRANLSGSLEVSYGGKQRSFKPLPQFVTIDLQEYEVYSEQLVGKIIKNNLQSKSHEIKFTKNIKKQLFRERAQVEAHLNNQIFNWFEQCNKTFLYSLSLSKSTFRVSSIDQPVGIVLMVQLDDNDCRDQFQHVKKEAQQIIKKLYVFNSSEIKNIKILTVILFDGNQGKTVKDALNLTQTLKRSYGIDQNLVARIEINGNNAKELNNWGRFDRPILHHNYDIEPQEMIVLISQQGYEQLCKSVGYHKNGVRSWIQSRLDELVKRYDEYNTTKNKFLNFFKASTPTDKNYTDEEKQARQLGDWYFLIEDYKKAYDVYKTLGEKMEGRDKEIENNIQEMVQLCLGISKYYNLKLKTEPYLTIEKHAQNILKVYTATNKQLLLRYMIFLIYMFHAFKAFNRDIIKEEYYSALRAAIHDEKTSLSCVAAVIHEQYASLSLLSKEINYRHYCYELTRVSSKFLSLKLPNHALRCLLLVQSLYEGSFIVIEKYVLQQLCKVYLELKNYQQAYKYIRKGLKMYISSKDPNDNETKQFIAHHYRYIFEIQRVKPEIIQENIMTDINIPIISNISVELVDEILEVDGQKKTQKSEKTDKVWVSWEQIGDSFIENKDMMSLGLSKAYFSRMFKQFDLTSAQEKSLSYQVNGIVNEMVMIKNSRIAYNGQPIKISFDMQNPFSNEMDVERIIFKNNPEFIDYQFIGDKAKNIIIKPYQKAKIEFVIIPKSKCIFSLKKLQWMLMKVLIQYEVPITKNHLTTSYYNLNVLDAVGRLKPVINGQQVFYEGESTKIVIELFNTGYKPIQSVYLSVGHEKIFGFKYKSLLEEGTQIQPNQSVKITLKIKIPLLWNKTNSNLINVIEKLLFLYKTENNFRCQRLIWSVNVQRVIKIQDYSCERLSTKLHLLTFVSLEENQNVFLDWLVIRKNFVVLKKEVAKSGKTFIHYYFLRYNESTVRQMCPLKPNPNQYPAEYLQQLAPTQNTSNIQISFLWTYKNRIGRIDVPKFIITFNRVIQDSKATGLLFLPFNFKTKYNPEITHCFDKLPILEIPVQIKIKNIFNPQPLNIQIYFTQTKNMDASWQGITNREVLLKQGEQVIMNMVFVVMREGIYDLADHIRYILTSPHKPVTNINHSQYQHLYLSITNSDNMNNYEKVITTDLI